MKKKQQRALMSVAHTWRCLTCLAETVRVLRGDVVPPETILCSKCYGAAKLKK